MVNYQGATVCCVGEGKKSWYQRSRGTTVQGRYPPPLGHRLVPHKAGGAEIANLALPPTPPHTHPDLALLSAPYARYVKRKPGRVYKAVGIFQSVYIFCLIRP